MAHYLRLFLGNWLYRSCDPLLRLPLLPHCFGIFFRLWYCCSIGAVQSADSSPTTVALKVKRCHMLDFLDHLRTIWQWAHSQKIQWAFSVLYHLWYCWVLKWHSQKINSERFLTLYPLLFPVPHTLMRQFGHLMWLTQERVNSNSSWLHWVSDQYNSGTKIIWTFWENLGFYPNIFFP
jgi:hypothetical protein